MIPLHNKRIVRKTTSTLIKTENSNQKDLLFIGYLKSIKIYIFYAINSSYCQLVSQHLRTNLNLNTINYMCVCLFGSCSWNIYKLCLVHVCPFLGTLQKNEFPGWPRTWSLSVLVSTSLGQAVWREKQHCFISVIGYSWAFVFPGSTVGSEKSCRAF